MVRAELQTARELAEQLFSLAQRAQDPALLLEAHRVLGQTMFWLGEWPQLERTWSRGWPSMILSSTAPMPFCMDRTPA